MGSNHDMCMVCIEYAIVNGSFIRFLLLGCLRGLLQLDDGFYFPQVTEFHVPCELVRIMS
jgi:hypothetical protein